ncbi:MULTISPECIES: hypothetical protein [Actinoalloteichus]|uniref:Uncharacterized protein n=1 Tax=Actinoalloteichus fjordicus TaxID=1612552 RepID=A0AAC9LCY2_9PSEU|nr:MULTISPECIES: hypothetical protein [Actinoalloteichus]APU14024.1 hypothetical protein UA74_09805 [Actinoalloteichus fjordicus]APU19970.1 hypothetical protein UA75_09775 [Actinoalloteichus sp. GBA129-24]
MSAGNSRGQRGAGRAGPAGRGNQTGCGLWLTAVFVTVASLLLWQAVTAEGFGRLVSACGAALLFVAAFATAGTSLNLGSGRTKAGCALTAALLLLAPGLLLLGGAYAGEGTGVIRVLVEVVGWLLVLSWLLVTIIAFGLGKAHRFVASVRGGLDENSPDSPAGSAAQAPARPGTDGGAGAMIVDGDPASPGGPAMPRPSPPSDGPAPRDQPDGDRPAH